MTNFADEWDKREKELKRKEATQEGGKLSRRQWIASGILMAFTITGIVAGIYWSWKAIQALYT